MYSVREPHCSGSTEYCITRYLNYSCFAVLFLVRFKYERSTLCSIQNRQYLDNTFHRGSAAFYTVLQIRRGKRENLGLILHMIHSEHML